LLPFKGSDNYNAEGEAKRQAVNAWIRSSAVVDGVIDFDSAVRNPADTASLLPAFDSGDHLHPNDAGYAAMAAAVDISKL
jgi:lysophospholipase L1-like esterase